MKRFKHNKPYNTMHSQYSSCGRWDLANKQSPSEIQRDTQRDRDRQTEIETERQTDIERERDRDRQTDREGESKQTRSCLLLLLLLLLFINPSHPRSSRQGDALEHTKQD